MSQSVRYLLDTDMCIYLLNGNETVKNRVAKVGVQALAISTITVAELFFGAHNSTKLESNVERVRAFITPPAPQILTLDNSSAEIFGRFKAELRRLGRLVGDLDLLIAAIASSYRLVLVTNNTAHFERIANLPY